jgi:hypothetical protein
MAVEVTAIIRFEKPSDVPTRFDFEDMLDSLDVDVTLIEYEEEEV